MPLAGYLLGQLFDEQGDHEAAEAAYRTVIRTEDPYWAPIAQIDLAGLLERQGKLKEARRLLEAAAASSNPEAIARAKSQLGRAQRPTH